MRKIISFFLAGALALVSCGEDSTAPIEVGSVKLNKTCLTLTVGEAQTLTAIVEPDNADKKTVVWKSSNAKVATVSNAGHVTGLSLGTATITATAGGKSASCTVTVEPITVESVTLDQQTLTLKPGGSATLNATVKPDNATDKTVAWSNDKPEVATVDEQGVVKAIAVGSATVTARVGGKTATCAVTVVPIAVESVSLDQENLTLKLGGSATLTATVTPEDATDKTVAWTSDKPEVATVDEQGVVKAVAVGSATVTARVGGKTATCTVTVDPVAVESVTLNQETLTLKLGGSATLKATVMPADATEVTVVWSSDKPEIATVDEQGVVKAVAIGTATVTAKAGDKTATCTVTVDPIAVESVTLDKLAVTTKRGNSVPLTATVAPADATDKTIVWGSDKPEVATVDQQGIVHAVAPGKATITAAAGGKTATCPITVERDVYVVGYMDGADYASRQGLLWINGNPTYLPMQEANSVFVADGKAYVAGNYVNSEGKTQSAVWKNGRLETWGDPDPSMQFYSIFVSGEDVYVAGGTSGPAVWKNGVRTYLAGVGSGAGFAKTVYVSGNDVYVGGNVGKGYPMLFAAAHWKNGRIKEFTNGVKLAEVTSIVESKGVVYMAGYEMKSNGDECKALFWKNNVMTVLSEDCKATGLAVAENGDVYVCGDNIVDRYAVLWKNGEMSRLDGVRSATAVCTDGENVYVSGSSGFRAVLWTNGTAETLTRGYDAKSVFVY